MRKLCKCGRMTKQKSCFQCNSPKKYDFVLVLVHSSPNDNGDNNSGNDNEEYNDNNSGYLELAQLISRPRNGNVEVRWFPSLMQLVPNNDSESLDGTQVALGIQVDTVNVGSLVCKARLHISTQKKCRGSRAYNCGHVVEYLEDGKVELYPINRKIMQVSFLFVVTYVNAPST